MPKSLDKMTHQELEKLRSEVETAMTEAKRRAKQDAKKAAEAAAAKFGFTLAELMPGSGRKGSKSKSGVAKYANPDDPTQTWTGKGRQPKWFKDAIAGGKSPSKLEV